MHKKLRFGFESNRKPHETQLLQFWGDWQQCVRDSPKIKITFEKSQVFVPHWRKRRGRPIGKVDFGKRRKEPGGSGLLKAFAE